MKVGDMVRIRRKKLKPKQVFSSGPLDYEEWWDEGGVVVDDYHSWEKIVSVLHSGKVERIAARDVQLMQRIPSENR
jgi:hypothetical protein